MPQKQDKNTDSRTMEKKYSFHHMRKCEQFLALFTLFQLQRVIGLRLVCLIGHTGV